MVGIKRPHIPLEYFVTVGFPGVPFPAYYLVKVDTTNLATPVKAAKLLRKMIADTHEFALTGKKCSPKELYYILYEYNPSTGSFDIIASSVNADEPIEKDQHLIS